MMAGPIEHTATAEAPTEAAADAEAPAEAPTEAAADAAVQAQLESLPDPKIPGPVRSKFVMKFNLLDKIIVISVLLGLIATRLTYYRNQ